MEITFKKLTNPTGEIVAAFDKWENDPALIPFARMNHTREDLEKRKSVTAETMAKRLEDHEIYLIYAGKQLVGEVEYQANPVQLYKKDTSTAWIGIVIGEGSARGQGVGNLAMNFIERQIRAQGFRRIELGVFEFNTRAIKLYQKLGYREIRRLDNSTYWQDRMWQDIRMEKYLE
jgi:RimJ/RimL family protein N-acetyltransferase